MEIKTNQAIAAVMASKGMKEDAARTRINEMTPGSVVATILWYKQNRAHLNNNPFTVAAAEVWSRDEDVIIAGASFEGAVRLCLVLLETGSEEGKQTAREELLRYGRELDRLKAASGTAFDPKDTPIEGE